MDEDARGDLGGRETGVQRAIRGNEDLAARFPLGSKWTPGPDDGQCPVCEVVGHTGDPRRPLLIRTRGRRDEPLSLNWFTVKTPDLPGLPWVPYLGDES